jgi:predicted nucleic acid-binding protein
MISVFVDSAILIEVSRGRNQAVLDRWRDLANSKARIYYSPITLAELRSGARPNEHFILDSLFGSLQCVPVTEEIGNLAGDFLRRYRKSHALEIADAIIAAGAASKFALLSTRNRKNDPMPDPLSFE